MVRRKEGKKALEHGRKHQSILFTQPCPGINVTNTLAGWPVIQGSSVQELKQKQALEESLRPLISPDYTMQVNRKCKGDSVSECHKFQGVHKQKQLNLISRLQTLKEVFEDLKDTWNSSLKPNWSIRGHYFALWGWECAHFSAGVSHGPAWASCGSVCHEHTSHNTWMANTWARAERPCHLDDTKRYNTPLAIFWTELDSFKRKEWGAHGLIFIPSWLVFFFFFWRSSRVGHQVLHQSMFTFALCNV